MNTYVSDSTQRLLLLVKDSLSWRCIRRPSRSPARRKQRILSSTITPSTKSYSSSTTTLKNHRSTPPASRSLLILTLPQRTIILSTAAGHPTSFNTTRTLQGRNNIKISVNTLSCSFCKKVHVQSTLLLLPTQCNLTHLRVKHDLRGGFWCKITSGK